MCVVPAMRTAAMCSSRSGARRLCPKPSGTEQPLLCSPPDRRLREVHHRRPAPVRNAVPPRQAALGLGKRVMQYNIDVHVEASPARQQGTATSCVQQRLGDKLSCQVRRASLHQRSSGLAPATLKADRPDQTMTATQHCASAALKDAKRTRVAPEQGPRSCEKSPGTSTRPPRSMRHASCAEVTNAASVCVCVRQSAGAGIKASLVRPRRSIGAT